MHWYHYALLFYWAMSGSWFLSIGRGQNIPLWIDLSVSFGLGWLILPVRLIERALR